MVIGMAVSSINYDLWNPHLNIIASMEKSITHLIKILDCIGMCKSIIVLVNYVFCCFIVPSHLFHSPRFSTHLSYPLSYPKTMDHGHKSRGRNPYSNHNHSNVTTIPSLSRAKRDTREVVPAYTHATLPNIRSHLKYIATATLQEHAHNIATFHEEGIP